MYPEGFNSFVEVNGITSLLEGQTRPTHFRGVTTVVSKLFNLSLADRAYFGQKDAQQVAVIQQMVRDLNWNIEIVVCPIVREKDGLAMSSRNSYLSSEERLAALVLSEALAIAQKAFDEGQLNASEMIEAMKQHIEKEPAAKIDYVKIVSARTLEDIDELDESAYVLLAVYIGKTRLIDNLLLTQGEK